MIVLFHIVRHGALRHKRNSCVLRVVLNHKLLVVSIETHLVLTLSRGTGLAGQILRVLLFLSALAMRLQLTCKLIDVVALSSAEVAL